MITEGYERCRQRKLPSMPSNEQKLPSMLSHERQLSATLMIPTTTYAKIYELRVWMVGGLSVRKWRCGGYGSSSAVSFVPLFPSLLCCLFLLWISARYKWRRHGFLPPTTGGGVSPCAGSAERSPLSCTDRLWDLWVRTIAYVG